MAELHAPNVGAQGLIPGQEWIHIPQQRPGTAKKEIPSVFLKENKITLGAVMLA